MAITSSSPEQVLIHVPLHERNVSPELITASVTDKSWECCHDCPAEPEAIECTACPCCNDRCGNENCQTCTAKSFKRTPSRVGLFGAPDDETFYTMCQIRRHDHADSAWLLVGDNIYDCTDYMAKHPGGKTSILKKSGGKVDCSVDFDFHSKKARKTWKQYKVGKLCPCPSEQQQNNFGTDEQCVIS